MLRLWALGVQQSARRAIGGERVDQFGDVIRDERQFLKMEQNELGDTGQEGGTGGPKVP